MPIYEYVCQDCSKKYEKFIRSRTTKVKVICPTCGSDQAKKAFSVFGAVGSKAKPSNDFMPSGAGCGPVG